MNLNALVESADRDYGFQWMVAEDLADMFPYSSRYGNTSVADLAAANLPAGVVLGRDLLVDATEGRFYAYGTRAALEALLERLAELSAAETS